MKLLMTLICALLVTCPARADDVSDAKEIFLTLLNNQKSDNNRFDSYLSPDCTLRWTETNKLKATTVVFDDAYMVSELTKRMIYGKHNVPKASISCSFEEKLVRVTWTTQSSPEKKSIYSMLFRHDEGGGIKIKEVVCIVPTSNVSDTNNVQLQTISVFDSGSMGIYSRHPFLRSIASFKSLNRILADGYADELSDDDKHDGELVSKLQGRDEHIIHTLAELKIGEILIPTSATAFDCSSSTTNFKTYRLSIPYAIKPNNDPNLLKTMVIIPSRQVDATKKKGGC